MRFLLTFSLLGLILRCIGQDSSFDVAQRRLEDGDAADGQDFDPGALEPVGSLDATQKPPGDNQAPRNRSNGYVGELLASFFGGGTGLGIVLLFLRLAYQLYVRRNEYDGCFGCLALTVRLLMHFLRREVQNPQLPQADIELVEIRHVDT